MPLNDMVMTKMTIFDPEKGYGIIEDIVDTPKGKELSIRWKYKGELIDYDDLDSLLMSDKLGVKWSPDGTVCYGCNVRLIEKVVPIRHCDGDSLFLPIEYEIAIYIESGCLPIIPIYMRFFEELKDIHHKISQRLSGIVHPSTIKKLLSEKPCPICGGARFLDRTKCML
jgi:hypothetical protein